MINKLRARRFLSEKSQYELANESGVAQSRISLLENGLIDPSPREKERLATALGVSEDEVFYGN